MEVIDVVVQALKCAYTSAGYIVVYEEKGILKYDNISDYDIYKIAESDTVKVICIIDCEDYDVDIEISNLDVSYLKECGYTDKDVRLYKSWYKSLYMSDPDLVMLSRYNTHMYFNVINHYLNSITDQLVSEANRILKDMECTYDYY